MTADAQHPHTASVWQDILLVGTVVLHDRWQSGGWLARVTLPLYALCLALVATVSLCIWGLLYVFVGDRFEEPERVRLS